MAVLVSVNFLFEINPVPVALFMLLNLSFKALQDAGVLVVDFTTFIGEFHGFGLFVACADFVVDLGGGFSSASQVFVVFAFKRASEFWHFVGELLAASFYPFGGSLDSLSIALQVSAPSLATAE